MPDHAQRSVSGSPPPTPTITHRGGRYAAATSKADGCRVVVHAQASSAHDAVARTHARSTRNPLRSIGLRSHTGASANMTPPTRHSGRRSLDIITTSRRYRTTPGRRRSGANGIPGMHSTVSLRAPVTVSRHRSKSSTPTRRRSPFRDKSRPSARPTSTSRSIDRQ